MLIIRNIIIVILLLCLAAISVVGIMVEAPQVLNWTPDRINALGRSVLTVMRPDYLLFLTWVVILIGVLLVFFITVARPRRRMKIEVQMGGGRVVIMDAAIKKYIRNALSEINEVTVKKIDLRETRGLVTTDIYADVRTRENLPVLERRIIGRVRAALAEDLGITNLGDVHVYIRNFEVTGRPITPAPAPAEQPERSAEDRVEADRVEPNDDESARVAAHPDKPLVEPTTTAAASTESSPETAIASGALGEAVEPPGSASPIKISDEDETTGEVAGLREYETVGSDPFASSEDKSPTDMLTARDEETISSADKDVDEPLPWGIYKKPETADDDKTEDKDQPRP